MRPDDRSSFVAALQGLAAMKPGSKLTPEAIELWWVSMRDWSLVDFKSAASHLARTHEFMPNPFHFEQLRKSGRPLAAEAWERARKASGSAIRLGHVTHNGTCGDELIDRAVRGIGGYGVIAMCDTDKLPFLERRFAEHYESLEVAEDARQGLPQIAHSETPRKLSGPTQATALLRRIANGSKS